MKTLKVMIVDDESIVINDLRTLIDWEKEGYRIVATANDGESALELIRTHRPDIAFIDIRLPRLDGLELSRRALSINGNTKILVLTAYRDFDYAKQALDIGALCYLLKHTMNRVRLLAVLQKAREAVMKDELQSRVIRRQLILDVLGATGTAHRVPPETIRKCGLPDGKSLLLLCLEEDRPISILADTEAQPRGHRRELSLDDGALPRGIGLVDVVNFRGETRLLLFTPEGQPAGMDLGRSMELIARAIQEKTRAAWRTTSSAAYLDFFLDFSSLKKGYTILKESLACRVFSGSESVFAVHSLDPALRSANGAAARIKGIDTDALTGVFNDLVSMICGALDETISARDHEEFRAIIGTLVSFLTTLHREKLHHADEMFLDRWRAEAAGFSDAGKVKAWIVRELQDIRAASDGDHRYSAVVRQTLEYIRGSYMRQACLDEAAASLGITCAYLGHKFRKETGLTFLQYLTGFRIEKAKTLLQTGRLKVYEIAEKVGYTNSQYFCRLFKEATSTTPHDYMDGIRPDPGPPAEEQRGQ